MPSLPLQTPALPLAPSTTGRRFAELDDRVVSGEPGVVIVRAASAETAASISTHLARRLTAVGLLPIAVCRRRGVPLFAEVGSRLGLPQVPCDPERCAEELSKTADVRRAALLVPFSHADGWDHAVALELAKRVASTGKFTLLVFLSDDSSAPNDLRAETFDIPTTLDANEKRRWWAAIADEAHALSSSDRLSELERWWAEAQHWVALPEETSIPPEDEGAVQRLALAGRGWPLKEVGHLGTSPEAIDRLVKARIAHVSQTWVTLEPSREAVAEALASRATPDVLRKIADALRHVFENDPWAHARAAELLLRAGAWDEADREHERAVTLAEVQVARRELLTRWESAIRELPREAQLSMWMRAAERALRVAAVEEAQRCAQTAAALVPDEDAGVALLLGRTAVAAGDLVAATIGYERGRACTPDIEAKALFAAELSEVAYLLTDLGRAEQEAQFAMANARDPATRALARNTVGKILLAQSEWTRAEQHFAEDTLFAASHGLIVEELRARLNRGIALLSKGLVDEARAAFESVLSEASRRNETRAMAFAVENLAVVATLQRDYAKALAHTEHALRLRQCLGDRYSTALILVNLAELRCRLGLFQYAEHAVTFGRRMLGPGMPPTMAMRFASCAARIALARGNTTEARREIAAALVASNSAKGRRYIGEAYRVAVRVALEDGDLARAGDLLPGAEEHATTDVARAEAALLRARLARASGEYDVGSLASAVSLARRAGDEELLVEAHTLACEVSHLQHDLAQANQHLCQALAVRDQVAATLPENIREAYLDRPNIVALGRLGALIESKELAASSERRQAQSSRRSLAKPSVERRMIGDDPAIRALFAAIRRVSHSDCTILIQGESGTGKELVAEAIHRSSDRANGPLVAVNCAALAETLLLSELFGHEKGAFTGAMSRRRGRFELAEGGTLFLDEIGDISPRTQVALLRVLQEKTFERVGGTAPIRADVRIVCATHRDLKAMVERGEFRGDLYYRLRGVTLELPPLRRRMGDLPRISEHLLERIAAERNEPPKRLSADALDLLMRHRWPGNVRELENVLRAASLFADGERITARCLVENVDDLRAIAHNRASYGSLPESDDDSDDATVGALPASESIATAVAYTQVRQGTISLADMKRQIERDCIARALAETKGNITRAAALLGMKRPRLSQLVKQYGFAVVSSEASS